MSISNEALYKMIIENRNALNKINTDKKQTNEFSGTALPVDEDILVRLDNSGVSENISIKNINLPSKSVTGVTDFERSSGAYVSSPTSPITSGPIPLVKTNSVNGAFSVIWYKGAVLSYTDFTGGDVKIFNGVNVANELCRIFVDYDKGNNVFSVGIQTGDTGITPATNTAPSTLTITEAIVTGAVNTAPDTLTITEAVVTA